MDCLYCVKRKGMERTCFNHAKPVNVLCFGAKQMSDFDKWCEKYWEEKNNFPCAGEAWDYQQKKIDAVKKHIDSFYAEAELWGLGSDQALHQIDLIQELLK